MDQQQRSGARLRPRNGNQTSVGHHQRVRASVSLFVMTAWICLDLVIVHADLGSVGELLGTGLPVFTSSADVAAVCGHDAAVCLCVVKEGVCAW